MVIRELGAQGLLNKDALTANGQSIWENNKEARNDNPDVIMATLSFQRAIPGGSLGEGAALATMMVPFLLAAILFSYFGLQRRAWQQGGKD